MVLPVLPSHLAPFGQVSQAGSVAPNGTCRGSKENVPLENSIVFPGQG